MADQLRRAGAIEEAAKVFLLLLVRFHIDGNRSVGNHLLQHPNAAVGAEGQGDRVAGARVDLAAAAVGMEHFEDRPEGVVLDGVDHHPFQGEAAGLHQAHHQVVTEGPGRLVAIEADQDVLGLGLVDPDGYLAAARGIAQQDDRTAAGGIEGDAGDAHFHHRSESSRRAAVVRL